MTKQHPFLRQFKCISANTPHFRLPPHVVTTDTTEKLLMQRMTEQLSGVGRKVKSVNESELNKNSRTTTVMILLSKKKQNG